MREKGSRSDETEKRIKKPATVAFNVASYVDYYLEQLAIMLTGIARRYFNNWSFGIYASSRNQPGPNFLNMRANAKSLKTARWAVLDLIKPSSPSI